MYRPKLQSNDKLHISYLFEHTLFFVFVHVTVFNCVPMFHHNGAFVWSVVSN